MAAAVRHGQSGYRDWTDEKKSTHTVIGARIRSSKVTQKLHEKLPKSSYMILADLRLYTLTRPLQQVDIRRVAG